MTAVYSKLGVVTIRGDVVVLVIDYTDSASGFWSAMLMLSIDVTTLFDKSVE